jgi:hypothetical protein
MKGPRKRVWDAARAKVEDEGRCRINSDCSGPLESAHIVGREHDERVYARGSSNWWFVVDADSIVPLCRKHHQLFDAHQLDLLGYLTVVEEMRAVKDAGGLENARVRVCPSAYRLEAA